MGLAARDEIFLDHCSTTPPLAEALEAHARVARDFWGNPSSQHRTGQSAARELNQARVRLAHHLGADPRELVFVSSGTEANNLAIQGAIHQALHLHPSVHAIIGADHHASVLEPIRLLERQLGDRFSWSRLPVHPDGLYVWELLPELLRPNTVLISVLHINNETGVRQDLGPANRLRFNRAGLLLHVDWVQSFGKYPIRMQEEGADLLSCSSHKCHALRGAGCLVVRHGCDLEPLIVGGAQERFRRAGTTDVAAIVAWAAAMDALLDWKIAWDKKQELERIFLHALDHGGCSYRLHGPTGALASDGFAGRVPGIFQLTFPGIRNKEDLLIALDLEGVRASATSACHSGVVADSHVLEAMGVPPVERAASIRIAFSPYQGQVQAQKAGEILARVVGRVQTLDPLISKA